MRDFLYNTFWGCIGGALCGVLGFGVQILTLYALGDHPLNVSPETLRLIVFVPGPVLGIAAWILVMRWSLKRRYR